MSDDLDYIAEFLGIDTKNPFILQDFAEIEDTEEFISFMRNNINSTELSYKNPLQKFATLKRLFSQEINKDRLHQAQSEAQKLAEKVKDIMHSVEKLTCQMDKHELIQVNKNGELEQYFTNFESKILNSIGNVRYVIRCYKYGDLAEKIEAEFRKVILKAPEVKQIRSPIEKIGITYKKM